MRLDALVYLFLSLIRFCIISVSYEYRKRSTRRTQFVPDDMLKNVPSKLDKYVIDKELQHTDASFSV